MIKTLRLPAISLDLLSFIQVIGASLFIALCARIEIPLFFTPVSITLQTFAVMLVGALLGPKKGVASVLTYLAEGCLGFPVFSSGASGVMWLFGYTGGYLFGFIVQAYLVGLLVHKREYTHSSTLLGTLLLSCLAQMTFGVLWLGHLVGWNNVLLMGLIPYIPGEMLKCIGVTKVLKYFKG